jgi:hypothetical protein
MRFAFAILIGLHGLIHLLGPTKAFGWAEVPQLRTPISPLGGALWLIAASLLVGAAIGVARGAHAWWWLALPGVALSQVLITQAWSDAKVGTLANLAIAIPLVLLALDARPSSFRSRFGRDRDALLARSVRPAPVVTEADLADLPPLMRTYLRRGGAVGRPRVRNVRVRFAARMRSSATSPWMPSTATQYEFFDPPARLFYMNATRSGVPFDIYHRYVDDAATFQVRIASVFTMLDSGARPAVQLDGRRRARGARHVRECRPHRVGHPDVRRRRRSRRLPVERPDAGRREREPQRALVHADLRLPRGRRHPARHPRRRELDRRVRRVDVRKVRDPLDRLQRRSVTARTHAARTARPLGRALVGGLGCIREGLAQPVCARMSRERYLGLRPYPAAFLGRPRA